MQNDSVENFNFIDDYFPYLLIILIVILVFITRK